MGFGFGLNNGNAPSCFGYGPPYGPGVEVSSLGTSASRITLFQQSDRATSYVCIFFFGKESI